MRAPLSRLVAASFALAAFAAAAEASAFCRTYSCDPAKSTCARDTRDPSCSAGGKPLFWPVSCVSFSLHKDASKVQGISFDKFKEIADQAFTSWQEVDCGGGLKPSLKFSDYGAVTCDKPLAIPKLRNRTESTVVTAASACAAPGSHAVRHHSNRIQWRGFTPSPHLAYRPDCWANSAPAAATAGESACPCPARCRN